MRGGGWLCRTRRVSNRQLSQSGASGFDEGLDNRIAQTAFPLHVGADHLLHGGRTDGLIEDQLDRKRDDRLLLGGIHEAGCL